MKITNHSRSILSLTSTLLCLFALMTPGLCQAADGAPPRELTEHDRWINPPLHIAVLGQNCTEVQNLLAKYDPYSTLINYPNYLDYTVLHIAAAGRSHSGARLHDSDPHMLEILLADRNLTDKTINAIANKCHNMTVLHEAATNRNPRALEILLAEARLTRKTINATDSRGNTVLHIAAKNSNPAVADMLLAHPLVFRKTAELGNARGTTAFHKAAKNSNPAVLQVFLNSKKCTSVLVNAVVRFHNKYTALHIAAQNTNPGVALALLSSAQCTPTLIEARSPHGETALHVAAENSNPDVLLIFLESDAITSKHLDAVTAWDEDTILHILARNMVITPADAYKVVAWLLSAKNTDGSYRFTRIALPNRGGFTALQEAVRWHQPGSPQYKALTLGEPSIFWALVGRAINVRVNKNGPSADAIRTHGFDSQECQAQLVDQCQTDALAPLLDTQEGGAAAQPKAENPIRHESHLRRTVRPNVGTPHRSSAYHWLT